MVPKKDGRIYLCDKIPLLHFGGERVPVGYHLGRADDRQLLGRAGGHVGAAHHARPDDRRRRVHHLRLRRRPLLRADRRAGVRRRRGPHVAPAARRAAPRRRRGRARRCRVVRRRDGRAGDLRDKCVLTKNALARTIQSSKSMKVGGELAVLEQKSG